MIKGIFEGVVGCLMAIISAALFIPLVIFTLIKAYTWESITAILLIGGGFLLGISVGAKDDSPWAAAVGFFLIICGVGLFSAFVSHNHAN